MHAGQGLRLEHMHLQQQGPSQQEIAEALLDMPQDAVKKVLASATAYAKATAARAPASNQEADAVQVDAEKRKASMEIAAALEAGAKKSKANENA